MSRRIRRRHQRDRTYYRAVRPDGTTTVISAADFTANVAAGNLIRDLHNHRLARVRRSLVFKRDPITGRLIFESARKPVAEQAPPGSTEALLRHWLESERTITKAEARRKMRASLPRVNTDGVCLY